MVITWAKTGRTTLAIWIWEKSKPQIPPTWRGSGHTSYCNRGYTELNPAGHNCTNCTYLGWLLPGVGFVQCGNCNHQWKEIRLGSYSPGCSVQLPTHPLAQILIRKTVWQPQVMGLLACTNAQGAVTVKPGVRGPEVSGASLLTDSRALTTSSHILGSRWKQIGIF